MSTKAYTYGYGICVEKIKDGYWDRDTNRMWKISW